MLHCLAPLGPLQYYLFANTVKEAAAFHQENIFEASRSLSEVVTAASISTNSSFPFVTVPQFEVFGGHAVGDPYLHTILSFVRDAFR
jgi:hypothetical protein